MTSTEERAVVEVPPPPKVRDDTFDLMKGVGISFVLLNHCFARGMDRLLGLDHQEHFWSYAFNRFIHFAVPVFLFVSCFLLTQSLARRFDLKRYATNRFRKTVVPYIVFSLFYLAFAHFRQNSVHPDRILMNFLTGKTYFHLYFTIVLIQVSIVVPVLVWLFRSRSTRLPISVAAAIGLQLVVYELNRRFLHIPSPGSTFLWYLAPLGVGFALGMNRDAAERLRPCRVWLAGAALLCGVWYVGCSLMAHGSWLPYQPIRIVGTWPSNSDWMNLTYALFTTALALTLWTWAPHMKLGRLKGFLVQVGIHSLPIFLIHPFVMSMLGGPTISRVFGALPLPILWFWLAVYAVSYGFGILAFRIWPGPQIFGQRTGRGKIVKPVST